MEGIVGFRNVEHQLKAEKHAHTSHQKQQLQQEQQDYLLKLKGSIINSLIEKGKLIEDEKAAEKDVKEAITCITGNKDSRPIKNDLNLLIAKGFLSRGQDIGIGKNRTKTILISSSSSVPAAETRQSKQQEIIDSTNKELDDVLKGYDIV